MSSLPCAQYLRECLDYNQETGEIVWRIRPRNHFSSIRICNCVNTRNGLKPAGYRRKDGYLTINVNGRLHYAHRLIWKMMTGQDPEAIDHRNLDKTDNRWCNLRACTMLENARNKDLTASNKSGFKGVHRSFGKYAAQITLSYKTKHLGVFETAEEASAAYEEATLIYHGSFARPSNG